MKKIFIFLGKNTIPTIIITIITLAVFATSVYGFVKIANLNAPIKDIPEVETVENKKLEDISPTPIPKTEENEQEDFMASPTPTATPAVINHQDNSDRDEVRSKDNDDSKIEPDDDLDISENDREAVHGNSDRKHPENPESKESHNK